MNRATPDVWFADLPHINGVVDGSRAAFPLKLRKASPYINHRVALVGDAAHVVHPMAGLGLNLGLGDCKSLAACIANSMALGQDLGQVEQLRAYNQQQVLGNAAVMGGIDGLWRLFHNADFEQNEYGVANDAVAALRSVGLDVFDHVPFVKSAAISFTQ